jgi:hypothetical protein
MRKSGDERDLTRVHCNIYGNVTMKPPPPGTTNTCS